MNAGAQHTQPESALRSPVVIVGFGVSGRASLRLLLDVAKDAALVVNDARARDAFDEAMVRAFENQGVRFYFGGHDEGIFAGVGTVVLSPGVPSLDVVAAAAAEGADVLGEIELALRYVAGDVIAVTGTNGKSTVVSLLSAMADAEGRPHFLGGNLGTPLSEGVIRLRERDELDERALFILELSSFQLETVQALGANVAALLNVTEDHAERYKDFAAYAAAKAQVFSGDNAVVVIPAEDEVTKSLIPLNRMVYTFGSGGNVRVEGEGDASQLVDTVSGLRVDRRSLRLVGEHNAQNGCAAMLIGRLSGLSSSSIEAGIVAFDGLPHRMQPVGEVCGVTFIDDSKATNVGAAVASMRSLGGRSFVLIAGGRDKDGDLSDLVDAAMYARCVVLLGEAAERFETALSQHVALVCARDLGDAVARAADVAEPGDVVLLAPACSSYDMFRSYVERGEAFAAHVHALRGCS